MTAGRSVLLAVTVAVVVYGALVAAGAAVYAAAHGEDATDC